MKNPLIIILCLFAIGGVVSFLIYDSMDTPVMENSNSHIYASWDKMEYDKSVAIWLIKRFYDKEATFVFFPSETVIEEGTVFDVPGAAWSRQHRKCTSDCILDSMNIDDEAVEKIVKIAHNVELNFWQLDSFPEAQKSFEEIMTILNKSENMELRIQEVIKYFDEMYLSLKKEN